MNNKLTAADREECAKVCEEWDKTHDATNYGACIANLIRSRK